MPGAGGEPAGGDRATAWEVAYATVQLLSGEASYINAHSLVLDGGATSFG